MEIGQLEIAPARPAVEDADGRVQRQEAESAGAVGETGLDARLGGALGAGDDAAVGGRVEAAVRVRGIRKGGWGYGGGALRDRQGEDRGGEEGQAQVLKTKVQMHDE